MKRGRGDLRLSRHAGGRDEHAVCADEIAAPATVGTYLADRAPSRTTATLARRLAAISTGTGLPASISIPARWDRRP
jgi:hypothetical protein